MLIRNSKSLLMVVLLMAGAFVLTGAGVGDPPEYGLRDLRGRYAFVLSGEITDGAPILGPFAVSGIIEADGAGNFPLATRTINVAGQLIVQNDTATGTYTVNPDGTGSAMFIPDSGGPPETFDFTIIDQDQFYSIATSPGVVGQGTAMR